MIKKKFKIFFNAFIKHKGYILFFSFVFLVLVILYFLIDCNLIQNFIVGVLGSVFATGCIAIIDIVKLDKEARTRISLILYKYLEDCSSIGLSIISYDVYQDLCIKAQDLCIDGEFDPLSRILEEIIKKGHNNNLLEGKLKELDNELDNFIK